TFKRISFTVSHSWRWKRYLNHLNTITSSTCSECNDLRFAFEIFKDTQERRAICASANKLIKEFIVRGLNLPSPHIAHLINRNVTSVQRNGHHHTINFDHFGYRCSLEVFHTLPLIRTL